MSIQFSADDIFQVAIRKEQDAAVFYNTAARAVDYPGGRQLLEELAGWEEKHEQIFSEMRNNLSDAEKEETAFDPYDENAQYLKAMADHSSMGGRYENPEQLVGQSPDFSRILNVALDKEKDTIAFYLGIQDLVPARFGQDKIGEILKEEKRHVRIITEQLNKLAST